MQTNPLISILMLTYNRADFLEKAIESVLAQTYENFELIIIDDGSSDNSTEIISKFNDPRIRSVRHEENKGLLVRRKESLAAATGKYVAICDSDDMWLPEKLERQTGHMEVNPECVLVGTWLTLVDDRDNFVGETKYEIDDKGIRNNILWRNQFAHSSVLIRKSALDKTAGYRFPLDEDLDLFLQLGDYGKLANIPEVLAKYRVHAGGASYNKLEMTRNVLIIMEAHKKKYPGYILARIKYSLAFGITYIKNKLSI